MPKKHYPVWAIALLIVALTVAACAPRAGGGEVLKLEDAADMALDLPALVIDFDSSGQPSIADMALTELVSGVAPGALDSLVLPPDVVQMLSENGVQHLQISNSPEGLLLLVNGEPIPSIKWDGEKLANTTQLIELAGIDLGAATTTIETLLPLINHLGIGVIARFPVPDGVEKVSIAYQADAGGGNSLKEAQATFLASVRDQPSITVPIFYDAQGSWRVGDLTSDEWISLTGMPVFDSIRLRPEVVDRLMQQGVNEFSLYTDTEGIHVSINGSELPYIGWSDGELTNVIALAEQMGLTDTLSVAGINADDVTMILETLLPAVQATEITVTAHFPGSLAVSSN